MRILHTSDWHIGKKIYEQDKLDEDTRFLDWLLETIIDRDVDIPLVSGDVFDSSVPPAKGRRWNLETPVPAPEEYQQL